MYSYLLIGIRIKPIIVIEGGKLEGISMKSYEDFSLKSFLKIICFLCKRTYVIKVMGEEGLDLIFLNSFLTP